MGLQESRSMLDVHITEDKKAPEAIEQCGEASDSAPWVDATQATKHVPEMAWLFGLRAGDPRHAEWSSVILDLGEKEEP